MIIQVANIIIFVFIALPTKLYCQELFLIGNTEIHFKQDFGLIESYKRNDKVQSYAKAFTGRGINILGFYVPPSFLTQINSGQTPQNLEVLKVFIPTKAINFNAKQEMLPELLKSSIGTLKQIQNDSSFSKDQRKYIDSAFKNVYVKLEEPILLFDTLLPKSYFYIVALPLNIRADNILIRKSMIQVSAGIIVRQKLVFVIYQNEMDEIFEDFRKAKIKGLEICQGFW